MKLLIFASLCVTAAGPIDACMSISSQPNSFIGFAGQSNIVIWDPNTEVEHFVRRATFDSNSESFEFVAPTPSVPAISKADRSAFDLLHRLTGTAEPTSRGGGGGAFGGGGSVSVIQQVEVGNLTATTLLASDSGALKKWLEDNEYKVSKTQDVWFDHYIKKGWYLTAFKVNSKRKEIVTEAIRMSFKTSQPFNPYYVPKENWSKNSKLELFLICPVPMRGFVGKDQPWLPEPTSQKWMKEDDVLSLSESLKLNRGDIPVNCQLTRYIDPDFAKGVNEDLFFYRT